ncbi:MAG: hypothetical protein MUO67_25315, partial [Anaerolineales bacterium]|nr:hypothetical protein [Anaerolineales bacterium]
FDQPDCAGIIGIGEKVETVNRVGITPSKDRPQIGRAQMAVANSCDPKSEEVAVPLQELAWLSGHGHWSPQTDPPGCE